MLDRHFTTKTQDQCFLHHFYLETVSYEVYLLYRPGLVWAWIIDQVARVTVWRTRSSQLNVKTEAQTFYWDTGTYPLSFFSLINNFSSYCLELLCSINWDPCLTSVGISRKNLGCVVTALSHMFYFGDIITLHPVLAFPIMDWLLCLPSTWVSCSLFFFLFFFWHVIIS